MKTCNGLFWAVAHCQYFCVKTTKKYVLRERDDRDLCRGHEIAIVSPYLLSASFEKSGRFSSQAMDSLGSLSLAGFRAVTTYTAEVYSEMCILFTMCC